jgi:hypothetical protein
VRRKGKPSWVLALSYVLDWVVLIAFAAVGYVLGDIEPNKRPFSLDDRNISYVDRPSALPPFSGGEHDSDRSIASPTLSTRRCRSGYW